MSTFTLRLPDSLKDRLNFAARRARKSTARFAREALEQSLKPAQSRTSRGASLYDLSRDLCGSVAGGPRDLASNKKHLNGYGAWKR